MFETCQQQAGVLKKKKNLCNAQLQRAVQLLFLQSILFFFLGGSSLNDLMLRAMMVTYASWLNKNNFVFPGKSED